MAETEVVIMIFFYIQVILIILLTLSLLLYSSISIILSLLSDHRHHQHVIITYNSLKTSHILTLENLYIRKSDSSVTFHKHDAVTTASTDQTKVEKYTMI